MVGSLGSGVFGLGFGSSLIPALLSKYFDASADMVLRVCRSFSRPLQLGSGLRVWGSRLGF